MRIVDLSHAYADDMPLYPGLPSPSFHDFAQVERDGYAMSEYHLLNHIGTHVDLPSHQIAGGATLDEIPLESFVTQAVTLDLSGREQGAVGWSELEPLLGDLHEGDWLFLCSDNGRNWGSDDYWTGGRIRTPRRRAVSSSAASSASASTAPPRIRSIPRRSSCTRSGWAQVE